MPRLTAFAVPSRLPLTLAALALVSFADVGCSRLTSPPEPEPMNAPANNGDHKASAAAPTPAPTPAAPAAPEAPLGVVDVVVGKGAVAKAGDKVKVQYTGSLTNGTVFDSSRTRNQPFEFVLGRGRVIKGWDEGVAGMKVGGKRKLTIPPSLGYGARGAGGKIPPNSTLLFDVELVEIGK
jgi:FKBP-type peptidyl-prolyl cis-trans isomerase FkpA